MTQPIENAIVYCEGAFTTTNGKTAHGLVRRSKRYRVLSVVDSSCAGQSADQVVVGATRGIPIVATVTQAVSQAERAGTPAQTFIVGLAPDGGRLPAEARVHLIEAIDAGLNVVSGLHDYLSEDA